MALFWRCVNTYRQAVEFTGLPWDLTQICMGWMGKNHTQSHFCIHGKVLSSTFRNFDIYIYNVLRYWLETGFASNMLLFAWHPKYLPAKQKWTTFTFNPMGNSYIYIYYNIQGEPGCPATQWNTDMTRKLPCNLITLITRPSGWGAQHHQSHFHETKTSVSPCNQIWCEGFLKVEK